MSSASAPPPVHIIRTHTSPISALYVSDDNERIYSGDSSGLVTITSTRTLRPIASWKAHTDGLLGVEEWGSRVITHARDNKLHLWTRPFQPPESTVGGSAAAPDVPALALECSLDVNALNYCRFALLRAGGRAAGDQALLAVPNLVESSLASPRAILAPADVWTLPSRERLHAAIGKGGADGALAPDGRGSKDATGIIMSMHLLPAGASTDASPSTSADASRADRALSLLAAYENGSVRLWRYHRTTHERSIEGVGWTCVWSSKLHVESIMAMAVARDRSVALSVSADHLVGRYDLTADAAAVGTTHRTRHPGNGAVALHDAARVCAIGGWDGRVRLFSTRTLKPLGTLIYHKDGVQALAFARAAPDGEDDGEDDELDSEEKARRARWLVSGGKDGRVAVWALMDFGGATTGTATGTTPATAR
ncbi:WD40 repeat-like protein [Gloeopeniophorella convolvens]|nr:WD40 repeat-like protein [Gloeopeniophorella convolvens]